MILGELAQQILGDNLIGLQLGNEPDLYYENGLRNTTYQPADYNQDFGNVVQQYVNDSDFPNKSMFVGPSICCGRGPGWVPELVWNTGYLTDYAQYLSYISLQ